MNEICQEEREHKTALDALETVRSYCATLREMPAADPRTVALLAFEIRRLLKERSLPQVVACVVETLLDALLDDRIAAFESSEQGVAQEKEKAALDKERLIESHKREMERIRDEYAKKRREENATTGKILITLVCVALGFVLAFKGAAPWVCALVYVALYVWGEKEPLLRAVDLIGKFAANKKEGLKRP